MNLINESLDEYIGIINKTDININPINILPLPDLDLAGLEFVKNDFDSKVIIIYFNLLIWIFIKNKF